MSDRILRRTFNDYLFKFAAVGGIAAGSALLGVPLLRQADRLLDERRHQEMNWLLNSETNDTFFCTHPAYPRNIIGLYANTHFAYDRSAAERDQIIGEVRKNGFQGLIVNINDALEPERLGEYDISVLDRVSAFIKEAGRNGLWTQVSGIDAYTMRYQTKTTNGQPQEEVEGRVQRAWNPVYGEGLMYENSVACGRDAGSIYTQEGYDTFFKDATVEYFKRRWRLIIETFADHGVLSAISAFNIGNELQPPENDEDGQIFHKWHSTMAPYIKSLIRSNNSSASVLSGAAHPGFFKRDSKIDGLDGLTLHSYPGTVNPYDLHKYLTGPYFLVGNELGWPEKVLGQDLSAYDDAALYRFTREIIYGTTVDDGRGTVYIGMPHLAPWKIDNCDDGFARFNKKNYPQTAELLSQYGKVLSRLRSDA